jgi:hypothetical protein
MTAMAIGVVALLSGRWLAIWQKLQEGRSAPRLGARKSAPLPWLLSGRLGAIFEKEALVMFRNGRNLAWLGFLFALWLAQAALNFFVRRNLERYQALNETIPEFVQALQVVVAIYFVSAFVLRFAFPSFSSERKTAWILASAPLENGHIYRAKLLFYAVTFALIGLAISLVNAFLIPAAIGSSLLFLAYAILGMISVTAFGMAMGALFPNFETDDPQVLSTSFTGLFFTAVSVAFGSFGAWALYQHVARSSFIPGLAFGMIALAVIAFAWFIVPRRIRHMEFVATQE